MLYTNNNGKFIGKCSLYMTIFILLPLKIFDFHSRRACLTTPPRLFSFFDFYILLIFDWKDASQTISPFFFFFREVKTMLPTENTEAGIKLPKLIGQSKCSYNNNLNLKLEIWLKNVENKNTTRIKSFGPYLKLRLHW